MTSRLLSQKLMFFFHAGITILYAGNFLRMFIVCGQKSVYMSYQFFLKIYNIWHLSNSSTIIAAKYFSTLREFIGLNYSLNLSVACICFNPRWQLTIPLRKLANFLYHLPHIRLFFSEYFTIIWMSGPLTLTKPSSKQLRCRHWKRVDRSNAILLFR